MEGAEMMTCRAHTGAAGPCRGPYGPPSLPTAPPPWPPALRPPPPARPAHLLGAALEVGRGFGHLGEHAGGLAHKVGAHLAPGDLLGLTRAGWGGWVGGREGGV